MSDEDDPELVRRCLGGDAAAFAELYEDHAPRAAAYFHRSGFRGADADDLTQETFIRAVRSLRTFDPAKGRLGVWLAAIARNLARREWSKVRGRAEDFDPQLAELTLAGGDNPGEESQAREETQAVRDCVASLPGELQEVVRLRYIDALTTRGIAQETGMPESTVRLRLQEAQEKIQRCLKGKGVLE